MLGQHDLPILPLDTVKFHDNSPVDQFKHKRYPETCTIYTPLCYKNCTVSETNVRRLTRMHAAFHSLDDLSSSFISSFCHISSSKHRNKLKRFVENTTTLGSGSNSIHFHGNRTNTCFSHMIV